MFGIRGDGLEDRLAAPGGPSNESPLPSRRRALDALLGHVRAADPAPALLTGEPGVGKSWLWRRMRDELPAGWRVLPVAISRALDAPGLLELIAAGLDPYADASQRGLASNRLKIARTLREDGDDGRRWILVLEEAQDASTEVWAEVSALRQGMEADDQAAGFAAMVLVGPTSLARSFMEGRRIPLVGRLGLHIHLLPLDVDECRALLEAESARPVDRPALEELQVRTGGNPRQLLRSVRSKASTAARKLGAGRAITAPAKSQALAPSTRTERAEGPMPLPVPPPLVDRQRPAAPPAPISAAKAESPPAATLIPSRPPLRVEEGLIEVGWDGSLDAEEEEVDGVPMEAASPEADGEGLAGPRHLLAEEARPTRLLVPADEEGEELAAAVRPVAESSEEDEAAGLPSEEMVEDHYAALQAWAEWAKNRGRAADPAATNLAEAAEAPSFARPRSVPAFDEEPEEPEEQDDDYVPSTVRAEAEHEHAPYSQLFSKLRQARP